MLQLQLYKIEQKTLLGKTAILKMLHPRLGSLVRVYFYESEENGLDEIIDY